MDVFDLAIKNGIRIDRLTRGRLEPIGKSGLSLALSPVKCFEKSFIIRKWPEFAQLTKIGHPAVADRFADGAGEFRVGQQQPTPRRNPIRLVVEPLRKHLGQVSNRHRAQQLGVDRCNTVGAVRSDNGQVRHSDLFLRTLLDQADAAEPLLVARMAAPNIVEKPTIDLEYYPPLPRHHFLQIAE